MSPLLVSAGLDLPALPAGHRLHPVIAAGLEPIPVPTTRVPWDADHFGLPSVPAWSDAPAAVRDAILARCNRDTLEEAVSIERIGLAFTARMVLLAPTVDERLLYARFAGDEARHFAALRPWVDDGVVDGPFLRLLAAAVEDAPRMDLVVLVQVVLEGWGLVHYRALADAARDPVLAGVLHAVLRDEARHHGGGLALAGAPGPAGLAALEALFDMVRAGPQAVVGAIAAELGGLGPADRRACFEALDTEAHAARRLAVLVTLLERADLHPVVEHLRAGGRLVPVPAEAC